MPAKKKGDFFFLKKKTTSIRNYINNQRFFFFSLKIKMYGFVFRFLKKIVFAIAENCFLIVSFRFSFVKHCNESTCKLFEAICRQKKQYFKEKRNCFHLPFCSSYGLLQRKISLPLIFICIRLKFFPIHNLGSGSFESRAGKTIHIPLRLGKQ